MEIQQESHLENKAVSNDYLPYKKRRNNLMQEKGGMYICKNVGYYIITK